MHQLDPDPLPSSDLEGLAVRLLYYFYWVAYQVSTQVREGSVRYPHSKTVQAIFNLLSL